MLKKNLLRYLMIFVVSLIVTSCISDPKIVYVQPEPPILPPAIENPVLEDGEITVNEYKLMINVIRWKILYHNIRMVTGVITEDQYQVYIDQYNSQIDMINEKIEELELLN